MGGWVAGWVGLSSWLKEKGLRERTERTAQSITACRMLYGDASVLWPLGGAVGRWWHQAGCPPLLWTELQKAQGASFNLQSRIAFLAEVSRATLQELFCAAKPESKM